LKKQSEVEDPLTFGGILSPLRHVMDISLEALKRGLRDQNQHELAVAVSSLQRRVSTHLSAHRASKVDPRDLANIAMSIFNPIALAIHTANFVIKQTPLDQFKRMAKSQIDQWIKNLKDKIKRLEDLGASKSFINTANYTITRLQYKKSRIDRFRTKDQVQTFLRMVKEIYRGEEERLDKAIEELKKRKEKPWWEDLGKAITDAFAGVGEAISGAFAGIGAAIFGALRDFANWFYENALKPFWDWIVEQVKGLLKWAIDAIKGFLTWIKSDLMPTAKPYLQSFYREVVIPAFDAFKLLVEIVKGGIKAILGWIITKLKPFIPLTPDKAVDLACYMSAIGVVVSAGTGILNIFGRIRIFGTQVDYTAITRAFERAFSVTAITAVAASVLSGIAVRTPLTYAFNYTFRPTMPSEGTLNALRGHGFITKEKYKHYMAYYGYPDEWIELMEKLTWTIPSERQLINMLSINAITEEKFREAIKWYGYDDEFVNGFYKLAKWKPSQVVAEQMFIRGIIDEKSLRQVYEDLGIPREWQGKFIANLRRPLTRYETRITWEIRGLTDDYMIKTLKENGYRPADIPYMLSYIKGFTARTEKMAAARRIVRDVREGYYTPDAARNKIRKLNIRSEIVEALMLRAEAESEGDAKADLLSSLLEEFEYGLISRERLLKELEAYGYDLDRLRTTIRRREVRRRRRLRDLQLRTIIALRQRHKIDDATCLQMLLGIGLDEDWARAWLEYAKATERARRETA